MRTTKVERILLAALMLPILAQAQEPIGRVLATQGNVIARAPNGSERQLTRRNELFGQETILVEDGGFAQIRMVDDAQIALGPGTEFKFERYRFDADPATADVAVMTLVHGCFRTVSGSIGLNAGDEHHIDTALASIFTRGTLHSATYDGDALYTFTQDGATTVRNAQGSVDLGIGGSYDSSRTLPGAAPEGVISQSMQVGATTCSNSSVGQSSLSQATGTGPLPNASPPSSPLAPQLDHQVIPGSSAAP